MTWAPGPVFAKGATRSDFPYTLRFGEGFSFPTLTQRKQAGWLGWGNRDSPPPLAFQPRVFCICELVRLGGRRCGREEDLSRRKEPKFPLRVSVSPAR